MQKLKGSAESQLNTDYLLFQKKANEIDYKGVRRVSFNIFNL